MVTVLNLAGILMESVLAGVLHHCRVLLVRSELVLTVLLVVVPHVSAGCLPGQAETALT